MGILRRCEPCGCNDWKAKIKELWEKYQGCVRGVKAGSITAYPDGDGIADIDGAVTDAIAQQMPTMLDGYVTDSELADTLENYPTDGDLAQTLEDYATTNQLYAKQDKLITGINLRSVNGKSLLGAGDILIPAKFVYQSAIVTVPASGGNVTVAGMTADALVWIAPAPASFDAYSTAGCRCTAQATNRLTFAVSENADAPMSVNVVWVVE